MVALSARQYRRILELAAEVVAGAVTDRPARLIAAELNDLLHGTATMYVTELDLAAAIYTELDWAPDAVSHIPWAKLQGTLGPTHPLAAVYATGASQAPLAVSDVVNHPNWRNNPCYERTDRELDGSTRHLAVPLPARPGSASAFITVRPGGDYTAREREMVRTLQPLLVGLERHRAELRRLRALLPAESTPDRSAGLDLTPRELTVLALAARGLTAAATGRRLRISVHTVNKHLENVYRKCGTHDRLTTVLLARDLGLIPAAGPK